MEQFVRVRMVKANGLDLGQFQFDWDLTFAVFFMNPDGTIYGRFGTRSASKEADRDISIEGFRLAMEGALQLHRIFPRNKEALAGKRGRPPEYKTPSDYPSLKGKYKATLDYTINPVKTCIHCHMVGDASRLVHRSKGSSIPDEILYPWPMPQVVGLTFDPKAKARVIAVAPESVAHTSGLRKGDNITSINDQPILSIADVQWTLHQSTEPTALEIKAVRNGRLMTFSLPLKKGWRRQSNISWRTTTWDLRRMTTGGLLMEELSPSLRKLKRIADDRMALRVKHVGQYGEHATAKRAGFLKEDIVISWNNKTSRQSESEVITSTLQSAKPGSTIPVTVLRGTRQLEFKLKMK